MSLLLSVLVTSYNREKYIAECLESILSNSFQDFELLVVDDASTDGTVEIVKSFAEKDSRIKLFVNEHNLGQFRNRNRAAALAGGQYIKYFDSDDIMHNDLLAVSMEAVLRFPKAGAGVECTWPKIDPSKLPVLFSPRECFINNYFHGNTFLHFGPSSGIYKKVVFDELGGFDESIGILADTLFMLQLAAKYPVAAYKPNLFYWRRHDDQAMAGQENYFEMMLQRQEINRIILNGPSPLNKGEVEIVKQNFKNIFLRNMPTHFKKLGSVKKVWQLFQIMDIKLGDFLRVFSKNKIIVS